MLMLKICQMESLFNSLGNVDDCFVELEVRGALRERESYDVTKCHEINVLFCCSR